MWDSILFIYRGSSQWKSSEWYIIMMNKTVMANAIVDKITNFSISEDETDTNTKVKKLWEDISEIIINHIVDNIDIQIPMQSVITTVSGGSGAPAVGVKNVNPIKLEVTG